MGAGAGETRRGHGANLRTHGLVSEDARLTLLNFSRPITACGRMAIHRRSCAAQAGGELAAARHSEFSLPGWWWLKARLGRIFQSAREAQPGAPPCASEKSAEKQALPRDVTAWRAAFERGAGGGPAPSRREPRAVLCEDTVHQRRRPESLELGGARCLFQCRAD